MLKSQRTVYIETLGICEHCGITITMEDMSTDSMNAKWICPGCDGTLTHKSFGFEDINGEWKKIQWVDEDKKWTTKRPTRGFDLGSWFITITVPARSYF